MKLFKVEVARTKETKFWVEAETEEEAREHADNVADEALSYSADYDEDEIYIYDRTVNTPKSGDAVWVGGEEGHWIDADEYENYLAEQNRELVPDPIPGQMSLTGENCKKCGHSETQHDEFDENSDDLHCMLCPCSNLELG